MDSDEESSSEKPKNTPQPQTSNVSAKKDQPKPDSIQPSLQKKPEGQSSSAQKPQQLEKRPPEVRNSEQTKQVASQPKKPVKLAVDSAH